MESEIDRYLMSVNGMGESVMECVGGIGESVMECVGGIGESVMECVARIGERIGVREEGREGERERD